ncbi:CotH kinase family protein [Mycolicibacterium komossense]|uniref:CotH kinase family protein n=1 Tax=Mycolicibacterium komossense TaxID=1779 RepID=A0ABT3CEE7_9MYCO|nr:CotH kinase family protein [Mycolicibacterium komossense]MCV7227856.1 CotH kinase family protein [Mycolicibacterium komossense]
MAAPIDPAPPPRRKLRHRVPVSLRQHWRLLAAFVVFVTVSATVFGSVRIRPYITGDATIIASEITENITGTEYFFDSTVSHQLSVDISAPEYNEMISAYRDNGEKKWVTADVTIDGTLITDAAVRLKGNSTLMPLRGDDFRPPGASAGFQAPGGLGAAMPTVSEEDPASLPLLISFSHNAEGRGYQGMTEVSVRPGSPVLNEALALSLTSATDQPTQRYTYTVYSINGGASATRLVVEHPDEYYANSLFDSDGYLYKADANSTLAYVGDDQAKYTSQFKQLNAEGTGDLQPIIRFVKWLDSADDAEFARGLGDWVDVESLARYLATQNLLVNADDMGGPGQNYYLWYALDSGLLSVISWDLNLAMQGSPTPGPHEEISMGMGPPAGVQSDPPPAASPPANRPAVPKSNSLKTRFLAARAFTDRYDAAYWTLYDEIYGSGDAVSVLDTVVARVPLSDNLTGEDLQSAATEMRKWIDERTSALAAVREQ